jgi:signal transduction histidine kinase
VADRVRKITLGALSIAPRSPDSSRNLFGRVRWHLILWYSAVLAGSLLVSSLVLYLAVQKSMTDPAVQQLTQLSQSFGSFWLGNMDVTNDAALACPVDGSTPPGDRTASFVFPIACFDASGKLLVQNRIARAYPNFASGTWSAKTVGQGGSAGVIRTSTPGEYNAIQRYAATVKVPAPGSGATLGVLVVGSPFGTQISTLDTLLHLLLLLGVLTLVSSAAAGLFLANRALQPARLAYARQRVFIADASHELRTPLTMLRSTVELVLRASQHLPPDDYALIQDAVFETGHLTNLANNMLSLANLESEETHIEQDVVELSELAAQTSRWAEPLASECYVTIFTECDQSVLVIADRSLLEQAALILLDNAIKYNRQPGEVHVRVTSDQGRAVLEVEDTGIGIPREHLPHLGERFYRVDKARSRKSGGAGLGLSIVRSIAHRHGGNIDLVSQEGVGTTAKLTLPAVNPNVT